MTDCQRIAELITPYVDEALDGASHAGVEQHVAVCAPCHARLIGERSARAALRRCAESLSPPLPPGLQSRCAALAREESRGANLDREASRGANLPPPPRLWRTAEAFREGGYGSRWTRVAVGAAMMAAAVLVFVVATSLSNRVLAAQLAADHVKCFSIFPPRDWTGMSEQDAERELAANGWSMRVPASHAGTGLKLLGVRGCLTGAGAIPHVLYESNGKPLSLFKLDGSRDAATMNVMGRQCRIWQRDDSTFVLVAEGDAGPELARVARYVEEEAR